MPIIPFDGTEGVRITKETANEYRLKGLAVRRHLKAQRAVWEASAKFTDADKTMLEFYGKFGFVGERKKLIDNKFKLIYPALKKAYDKGKFDAISKFFEMVGLTWASDAAEFLAAYNVTIKAEEEGDTKREPTEVIIKRFGDAHRD